MSILFTTYLPEFLTVATVHLLAVMSPGPDFVMISRNSLVYSRKTGICSAIGLGLGILVHITYCLLGIGLIISKSIVLFSIMKYLGAAYLLYIGWKSITSKSHHQQNHHEVRQPDPSTLSAIRMGFFTNVLNPKATLFFFALFTQVISAQTPITIQIIYGTYMAIATAVWFTIVALILSHHHIKQRFTRIQHHVERVLGVVLIALGIKVALSTAK
ncbi:MAG: amino acid transporter [Deltaproteobacteria bacterium CG11_big_fil_rev_8_21_14_0_20_47_16]|nr:MAG: amino acid transporter [Deltaproteobacteria bacterium CG11_big_fil_rev_8_21_14_0_20_47_16]